MGNEIQAQTQSKFLSKYSLISEVNQFPFGRATIFRKKEENYDYIMLMKRSVNKQYIQEIQKELLYLKSYYQSDHILRIFELGNEVKIKQPSSRCHFGENIRKKCRQESSQTSEITIFMEYFNYSLKDYVQYKRTHCKEMTLQEITYVLRTCLAEIEKFQSFRFHMLGFQVKMNNIFINTFGCIKLMPFVSQHIEEEKIKQCNFSGQCQPSISSYDLHETNGANKENVHPIYKNSKNIKRQSYLHQIKQIANELFTTIRYDLSLYSRNNAFLEKNKIDKRTLIQLRQKISSSKSLKELKQVIPFSNVCELNLNNLNPEDSRTNVTDYYAPLRQKTHETNRRNYYQIKEKQSDCTEDSQIIRQGQEKTRNHKLLAPFNSEEKIDDYFVHKKRVETSLLGKNALERNRCASSSKFNVIRRT